MTATNHAITGALIVYAVVNPVVALPLAFISHFVLDSLPHYGERIQPLSKRTTIIWCVDFVLLSSLFLFFALQGQWLLLAGSLAAISPDIAWIYRFAYKQQWGRLPASEMNRLNRFHSAIQKYEFKNGVFIEVLYAAVVGSILMQVLGGLA